MVSVTEAERHRLYESLKSVLGETEADIMMSMVPPLGWGDVATRRDVSAESSGLRSQMEVEFASVRGEMRAEFAEVRGEIAEVRGEIADVRGELRTDIAGLRGEMRTEIAEVRGELHAEIARQTRMFVTWLVASQSVVIAVVGLLHTLRA